MAKKQITKTISMQPSELDMLEALVANEQKLKPKDKVKTSAVVVDLIKKAFLKLPKGSNWK